MLAALVLAALVLAALVLAAALVEDALELLEPPHSAEHSLTQACEQMQSLIFW